MILKELVRFKAWPFFICLCFLSGLGVCIEPSVVLASPPNVVLSRATHFPTMAGSPVTLSPGKYFVEQVGTNELRLTADSDNQKFLIQAQTASHEQYELFSAMALTRPNKTDEILIELFLPGGVRLEARGSTQELPTPSSPQKKSQLPRVEKPPSPPPNAPEDAQVAVIIPDPEPPIPPQNPDIREPLASNPMVTQSSERIPYNAPNPDQPGLRIDARNADNQFPSIVTLSPNHVGQTGQKQPVFYWYLSKSTEFPLDVIIAEEGNLVPLLNIQLLPPLQSGINELPLKDYGLSLLPNVQYRWTVRILSPQASERSTASGVIQRIESSSGSSTSLEYSPQDYAEKGLWYDALTALNLLIQGNPNNDDLLAQRASLLKQVGLPEAAGFLQQTNTP